MIRTSTNFVARNPRRGITIIETLILITCMGFVLGTAAITIQAMLRLSADSQVRLTSSLVLERLASQLRADAHASAKAGLEGADGKAPGARAILKLVPEPGREVTYKLLAKSIDRDETAAGKKVRHESFMLPRGQHASFELVDLAGRAIVSLVVEPDTASSGGGSLPGLEVLALVGKHRGVPIKKTEGRK